MKTAIETAAGNPQTQDRGAVVHSTAGLVLVVADGAGGMGGGAEAAEIVVDVVHQEAHELLDSASCVALLQKMDQAVAADKVAGETTCVLAVVTPTRVFGASVGDSGAWLVRHDTFSILTEGQSRKPFIGSGSALAVPFEYQRTENESLLLATDGLLKYTSADRIMATCRSHDPAEAALKLVGLVRYPSGNFPDDVTVVVAGL